MYVNWQSLLWGRVKQGRGQDFGWRSVRPLGGGVSMREGLASRPLQALGLEGVALKIKKKIKKYICY